MSNQVRSFVSLSDVPKDGTWGAIPSTPPATSTYVRWDNKAQQWHYLAFDANNDVVQHNREGFD